MARQKIELTPLCTTCFEVVFAGLSKLLPRFFTDPTTEFSYSTKLEAIRQPKNSPCGWCQELYGDLEQNPMFLDTQVSVPLTIVMDIRHGWHISPISRHAIIVSVRKEDAVVARLHYEMFLHSRDILAIPRDTTNGSALDKSFEKVKQLIDNCDTHPSCHPATAVLPTRVIDLWPDESPRPGRLRLYESDRVTARYATLSYCWGGPQTFLATRETYRTLIDDGFDVEDLPPTIQDAICTTRRLGIRYLWVDALCIIQDSESDKRHEISQMRNIFRRSYVTVVAAAAKCVSDGFLQRIDPVPLRGSLKLPLKLTDGTVGCVFLSRRHEATYIPIESVNNRAWTLEEKLLSRRILIFGEYSLRWQCQSESETIIGELFDSDLGGSDRLPAMLSSKDNASVDRFELREIQRAWAYILSEYGQRELTHTKDKLIALAGIAEEFQRFWGDKYLAGLWQRTLSRDLLWQIFKPSPRLKEYRAPSWSWASVDGEILSPLDERTITDFEVLACDVNLVSDMLPLGAVTGGRLKVKGVVRKAFYNSGYQLVLQTEAQPVENIGTVAPDALEEYPIGENELKMVWCLQISCESIGPTGMVLIPAAGDVFQRIGRFTAPGKKDWFRNGRQQILVIK